MGRGGGGTVQVGEKSGSCLIFVFFFVVFLGWGGGVELVLNRVYIFRDDSSANKASFCSFHLFMLFADVVVLSFLLFVRCNCLCH